MVACVLNTMRTAWHRLTGRTRAAILAIAGLAAVLGLALWSIGPAIGGFASGIITGGNPGGEGFFYGDAFEPLYHWWVWLWQVGHLSNPYVDPFSFGALVDGIPNQMGWPFAPLFGMFLAFGTAFAYNAVLVLTYPLAGGATYLWLRATGIGRAGCIAGGLLMAFFPTRVNRLFGHYVAWLVILIPLALWMIERAARADSGKARIWWSVGFGITLITIVQAGEFYFALFGTLVVVSYAILRLGTRIVRERGLWMVVGGILLAGIAALLMRWWFITGSFWAGGRPLFEAQLYSPLRRNFLLRDLSMGGERFTYIGILGLLAIPFGLIAGWRRKVLWFWAGWGVAIGVFALGTSTSVFPWLHDNTGFLSFARSVTRPLPIVGVGLALFAALAVQWALEMARDKRTRRLAATGAVMAVAGVAAWDSSFVPFESASAAGLEAQSELLGSRDGSVISAPVFDVTNTTGVAYMYATISDPRASANGYSPYTPKDAVQRQEALRALDCGIAGPDQIAALRRYDIRNALTYPQYYGTPWSAWNPWTMISAFQRMQGVTQIGVANGVWGWTINPAQVKTVSSMPRDAIPGATTAVQPCTGWDSPSSEGQLSRHADAFLWAIRETGAPPLAVTLEPGPIANVVDIGVVGQRTTAVRLPTARRVVLPVPDTGRWTPLVIAPRRHWKAFEGQPESYGVRIRNPLPPLR